jgi:hypothetical protein
MTARARGADSDTSDWMERLKTSLDPIDRILAELPGGLQPFKQAAFTRLFDEAVKDARLGSSAEAGSSTERTAARGPTNALFQKFLTDYKIDSSALSNIVDIESGQVLARTLHSTRSESQRRLAALLSVAAAHRTGDFAISRDQLVDACKAHGVYDSANFASNMTTDYNGSVIFIKDLTSGGYKVSRPGEAYLAMVIRDLLPKSEGA